MFMSGASVLNRTMVFDVREAVVICAHVDTKFSYRAHVSNCKNWCDCFVEDITPGNPCFS